LKVHHCSTSSPTDTFQTTAPSSYSHTVNKPLDKRADRLLSQQHFT
jgi:hypothetical protein